MRSPGADGYGGVVRDVAATWADRWPVLGRHERAAEWLRVWADLGRAPRTIDAYARGLAEYLRVCERDGTDRLAADYLVEEGAGESNPVGRGHYTRRGGFGGRRGLLPR